MHYFLLELYFPNVVTVQDVRRNALHLGGTRSISLDLGGPDEYLNTALSPEFSEGVADMVDNLYHHPLR